MRLWAAASPLLLAGLLPLKERHLAHWAIAGAWRYPVGDPYAVSTERDPSGRHFYLLRGLEGPPSHRVHEGADIGDGHGGDTVRAAAAGLVAHVDRGGDASGYGGTVVLAHRLPDGTLAYSVYAHLARGTIGVRPGDPVAAGEPLARVGQTGRATVPHLHFEVRTVPDPAERWEHAPVEDPLAFVGARLPALRHDTTEARPWLEWGESHGLLAATGEGRAPLSREDWWRMLAAAAAGPPLDPHATGEALRDSLIAAGLLPASESNAAASDTAGWRVLARDLARLRARGLRLAGGPLRKAALRAACARRFGRATPVASPRALARRHGTPTAADACLLVASLAGPPARPALSLVPARRAKRAHAARAPAP